MSLTFGFFDSVNGDRKYNAQQMSAIFDGIINDGVFDSVGDIFAVSPVSGMNIKVGSGRAWFDHTWTYNDTDYPLTIAAAEAALTRIDAVVLEVNNDSGTRANTLKVIKGVASISPKKPTLTNTATLHQHALAYITIASGTTAIRESMIAMAVGTSETPFVTGILETTTIEALWSTWEGQFQDWFENVKGQLGSDAAGNLQNQVNERVKIADKATLAEAKAGTNDTKWMTPAKTAALLNPLHQCRIGDVYHSAHNIEEETNGAFIAMDGRTIDRVRDYPNIADAYELQYRISSPSNISTSGIAWSCSYSLGRGASLNGRYFWIARYSINDSSSYYASLCMRDISGNVTQLITDHVAKLAVCNNNLIAVTEGSRTVRAYVFDENGGLLRNIQLYNATNADVFGVYVNGSRCFILTGSNWSNIRGYYSDDNFATYGTTLFDGLATPSTANYITDNDYDLTPALKVYNGGLYIVCYRTTNHDDYDVYTLRLWKSTNNGTNFTTMWTAEYRSDDSNGCISPGDPCFIYNDHIYMNGYYSEKVSSSTYNRGCLFKLSLANGSFVARSEKIYDSTLNLCVGFVSGGYLYASCASNCNIKMNLDTLIFETWYPIYGSKSLKIDLRNARSLLKSDGKYWIAFAEYLTAPPTTGGDNVYGGILVYHIPTNRGVYLTDGLTTSGNYHCYFAIPFEDDDGNVIIPQGYLNSNDDFAGYRINKIDFSKITLPQLDYAYIKTRELDA